MDIDSYDCELLELLLREVHASVIVAEFNSNFPPPIRFSRLPHPSPNFRALIQSDTFGCSLAYIVDALAKFGFSLLRMSNEDVIFLKNDLFERLGEAIADPVACYRDVWLRAHEDTGIPAEFVREWFFSLDPLTANMLVFSNVTSLSQRYGILDHPFTTTVG